MSQNKLFFRLTIIVLVIAGLISMDIAVAAPEAMPLISRNVPAYASSDYPSSANDINYGTTLRGTIPGWIAYDLSSAPTTPVAVTPTPAQPNPTPPVVTGSIKVQFFSFNSSATTFVDWTKVTGYVSNVLQWGTEP